MVEHSCAGLLSPACRPGIGDDAMAGCNRMNGTAMCAAAQNIER